MMGMQNVIQLLIVPRHLRVMVLLVITPLLISAQKSCSVTNQAFQSGEELSFVVNYNWGAIWMTAAEVTFSVSKSELNGRQVYHFEGVGGTYPKYDWFYKVRDKYEAYADTVTLSPFRFRRVVNEGGTHLIDDYVFSQKKKKVYTSTQKGDVSKLDSLAITACTNDVITSIFYARCLDFSAYKPKDTIPISFVLDGEVFNSYIRYMGKEVIYSELLGNVQCIKFKPKLVEGTIFKGGEGMTVWVTDDKNKMPVYVETPIIVGTIKVNLNKYKGLRHPINCFAPKTKE
jgi:hypothetical protein